MMVCRLREHLCSEQAPMPDAGAPRGCEGADDWVCVITVGLILFKRDLCISFS